MRAWITLHCSNPASAGMPLSAAGAAAGMPATSILVTFTSMSGVSSRPTAVKKTWTADVVIAVMVMKGILKRNVGEDVCLFANTVAFTGSMAVSDIAPDAGVLGLSVVVKNLQFLPGANGAVSLNLQSLNTANIRAAE